MRYAIAFFEEQKLNGSAPGSQSGSVRWLVVQFGEFEDHQRPRVEQKSKSRKANRTQLVQTPHPTRTHHPLHRCTDAQTHHLHRNTKHNTSEANGLNVAQERESAEQRKSLGEPSGRVLVCVRRGAMCTLGVTTARDWRRVGPRECRYRVCDRCRLALWAGAWSREM